MSAGWRETLEHGGIVRARVNQRAGTFQRKMRVNRDAGSVCENP